LAAAVRRPENAHLLSIPSMMKHSSPGIRVSYRCLVDNGNHRDSIDVSNPVRVEEWEVTDPPPAGTGPSAHRGDLDVGIRGEHVLVLADHLPDDLHGQPALPGVLVDELRQGGGDLPGHLRHRGARTAGVGVRVALVL